MKVTDDRLLEELIDCKKRGKLSDQLFDFCHQLIIHWIEKAHDFWDEDKYPYYARYKGAARERMISHTAWKLCDGILHFNPEKSDKPIKYAQAIIGVAVRQA